MSGDLGSIIRNKKSTWQKSCRECLKREKEMLQLSNIGVLTTPGLQRIKNLTEEAETVKELLEQPQNTRVQRYLRDFCLNCVGDQKERVENRGLKPESAFHRVFVSDAMLPFHHLRDIRRQLCLSSHHMSPLHCRSESSRPHASMAHECPKGSRTEPAMWTVSYLLAHCSGWERLQPLSTPKLLSRHRLVHDLHSRFLLESVERVGSFQEAVALFVGVLAVCAALCLFRKPSNAPGHGSFSCGLSF